MFLIDVAFGGPREREGVIKFGAEVRDEVGGVGDGVVVVVVVGGGGGGGRRRRRRRSGTGTCGREDVVEEGGDEVGLETWTRDAVDDEE